MAGNLKYFFTFAAICFASAAHATLPLIPESSIGLDVQTQCEQTTSEAVSSAEPILVVEEQDLQAADPELLKCKELLDKALSATCPTLKKRAGLAAGRSVSDAVFVSLPLIVSLVILIFGSVSEGIGLKWIGEETSSNICGESKDFHLSSLIPFAASLVGMAAPFALDHFMKFDDQSLKSLKAFEQTLSKMTPEQKTAFVQLFKAEFEKLMNKINAEKDSTKAKVAGFILNDAVAPFMMAVMMVAIVIRLSNFADKNPINRIPKHKLCDVAFVLYIVAIVGKIAQSVYNFKTSPEKQKQAITARLNKILAVA